MTQITIDGLNIGDGKIVLYDFIDLSKPIEDQIWSLKEDMLQIEFYDTLYLIDVGWPNEFETDGCFRIMLIKNLNWEEPLEFKEVSHVNLISEMNSIISKIMNKCY
jgi:hypothetical protein